MSNDKKPIVNTSIGVVIRLDAYFKQADYYCFRRQYGQWGRILDIIYRTLSYENHVEQIRDVETDKLIKCRFTDEEAENKLYYDKKIGEAISNLNKVISERNLYLIDKKQFPRKYRTETKAQYEKKMQDYRENIRVAENARHIAYEEKNAWLIKYASKLNLYMVTQDSYSNNALFGGKSDSKR